MNLVVLGANGRTGAHVVNLALDQGVQVTAVVRSKNKCPNITHKNLNIAIGNPCDPMFLTGVFQNQNAVISTLGGRLPTKKATSVYYLSADAIAKAAETSSVKKVIVTSSALLFSSERTLDNFLAAVFRQVVRSATRMEEILGAANLNARIARCGFLTDANETQYRATKDHLPENGSSVSRRSLASFLMDSLSASWSGEQVFGVSCPLDPRK